MKKGTDLKQNLGDEAVRDESNGEVIPKGLVGNIGTPDPEVLPMKKVRRRHTISYKREILEETDKCSGGELGALLRREGLYSLNLSLWRKQRESGVILALADKKRGVKPSPDQKRINKLEREKAILSEGLKKARMIIEVQKKISEIFLPETLPLPSVKI